MSKLIKSGMILIGLLQAAPSFGLVRLMESCQTSDGKYTLSITDNQGIGPVRKSHFGATIRNEDGDVVGSYGLNFVNPKIRSASFGHASYMDSATNGKEFNFALPSTNTPFALTAVLENGEEIRYGLRFNPDENQGNLICSQF